MVNKERIDELAKKAAKGDREAFDKLVEHRKEKVFWIAYRIVGNYEEAKEVTQEAFIKLWDIIERYNPDYHFDTWMYRIVTNLSIDHLRKLNRYRVVSLEEDSVGTLTEKEESIEERFGSAAEKIFQDVTSMLTERQKAIFTLSVVEELTSSEIGEILDISPSTVRNHLKHSRDRVRDKIKRKYPEYSLFGEDEE